MATIKLLLGIVCFAFAGSFHDLHRNLLANSAIQNRIANPANINYRSLLVNTAKNEIGIREETGTNDGPRIKTYLASVNIKNREPWCAAFICWIYKQHGFLKPRSAWSPDLFPNAKLTKTGLPGDIYGIYFSSKKRIAHVGMVELVKGDWCVGIEGNTNLSGAREGDGVYRKRRNVKTIYRCADWVTQKGGAP